MRSSLMTVFLWMWLTIILVIWTPNLWRDVSKMEYLPLSWKKSYLFCQFNIPYCMESCIYVSQKTMGKLTVYLFILSLQLFDHTKTVPNIFNNESKICLSKIWSKNKLRKSIIIRMIRLPWHIQMFRKNLIRSPMKYCLQ